jgi:hypothetical protein
MGTGEWGMGEEGVGIGDWVLGMGLLIINQITDD